MNRKGTSLQHHVVLLISVNIHIICLVLCAPVFCDSVACWCPVWWFFTNINILFLFSFILCTFPAEETSRKCAWTDRSVCVCWRLTCVCLCSALTCGRKLLGLWPSTTGRSGNARTSLPNFSQPDSVILQVRQEVSFSLCNTSSASSQLQSTCLFYQDTSGAYLRQVSQHALHFNQWWWRKILSYCIQWHWYCVTKLSFDIFPQEKVTIEFSNMTSCAKQLSRIIKDLQGCDHYVCPENTGYLMQTVSTRWFS